jgi:hypothetical protein
MAFTKQNYIPGDVLSADKMNEIQDAILKNEGNIDGHIESDENPHGVTAKQVGAISRTLIWENSNPVDSFAKNTINPNHNMLNFDGLEFVCVDSAQALDLNDPVYLNTTGFIPFINGYPNTPIVVNLTVNSVNGEPFTRTAVINKNENSITISEPSSGRENIDFCIPLYIYGIKGVQ